MMITAYTDPGFIGSRPHLSYYEPYSLNPI